MLNVNLYPSPVEMIEYTINPSIHKDFTSEHNIRSVIHPNYADLRREIMVFNEEIMWSGMWTFEDAKQRLSDGWIFVCLFIDHQVKGWVWFEPKTNILRNLYVNSIYRNKGYGSELVKKLCVECHKIGIKNMISYVDEWNESSHKVFLNTNWVSEI